MCLVYSFISMQGVGGTLKSCMLRAYGPTITRAYSRHTGLKKPQKRNKYEQTSHLSSCKLQQHSLGDSLHWHATQCWSMDSGPSASAPGPPSTASGPSTTARVRAYSHRCGLLARQLKQNWISLRPRSRASALRAATSTLAHKDQFLSAARDVGWQHSRRMVTLVSSGMLSLPYRDHAPLRMARSGTARRRLVPPPGRGTSLDTASLHERGQPVVSI